jgi:histidine triad (HIT) family protein
VCRRSATRLIGRGASLTARRKAGVSGAHAGDSLSPVADCIFCAIAAGEAPATIIDQDSDTISFMDINPWRRGHALVVPRRHSENLLEIAPDDLTKTFAAAQRLAARMKDRLGTERVVLWNSCGSAAGQVIMHFHVHVIPADPDDPPLPPRPEAPADEADIAATAAALRNGA